MTLISALANPRNDSPPSGSSAASGERRLRVAIVTEYYYPHIGGVTEHVHFMSRELRRRGHHVDIITSRLPGAPPQRDVIRLGHSVPVYSNGSMARLTVGVGLRDQMRGVLRDGAYDIVHVHAPFAPTLPMLAAEEAQCPVAATVHTWFPRSLSYRIFRGALERMVARIDLLIAVSTTAVRAHQRYFEADWQVVPNGIDLDLFSPDAPRPAAFDDRPVVLFVGRFDPRNSLGTMIRAFRHVARGGRKARLMVVGDGPLRPLYEPLARNDPHITFAGTLRDERPSYYAHSTVYACPTTRASFGMTLLEAMASGTPVLCSDIVGFRDVVQHHRDAILTPRGDTRALSDNLAMMLDDADLRARLRRAGMHTAAKYAWFGVAERVLQLYQPVLARSVSGA